MTSIPPDFDLQEQLRLILVREPPHDLFARWRPLHGQAIGWEPNLIDGVTPKGGLLA